MDDTPLVRLHGIHHHPLARAANPLRQPKRHLLDRFLAPVAIVLDVDHQPAPVGAALVEDQVDHRLKRAEGLAPPADQESEVIAGDIDHHRILSLPDEDLGRDAHLVEQLGHDLARPHGVSLAYRHPHPGFLWSFVEYFDLHVLARFLQVFERLLDGIIDGRAGGLHAVAARAHAAFPLPRRGGESDPQPVMKYCWPMLKRLLTTQ